MKRRYIVRTVVFALVAVGAAQWPQAALAVPNHLIINEVQISGGTGHTTDDFIELYNPTRTPIDVRGYRLVKRAANGANDTTIKSWTSSTVIASNGYYLWANSGYVAITTKPNTTTSQAITNDNGIALRHGAADTGTIIDSLAWGTAHNSLGEGKAYPTNPPAKQSLTRQASDDGVVQDTGSNADDFTIATVPTPQSTLTTSQLSPTTTNTKTETSQTPHATTIADIDHGSVGDLVSTTGLVTKVTKTGFTMQENDKNLRVALRDRELPWQLPAVGMRVTVTGTTAVSRGQVELRPRTPADIMVEAVAVQPEAITLERDASEKNYDYAVLAGATALLGAAYLWQRYRRR